MDAMIPPGLDKLSAERKCSYLLFAGVFLLVGPLHLGPPLLAGLFSYMMLDVTQRRLKLRVGARAARWGAVAVFLIAATGLFWLFGQFLAAALSRVPEILSSAIAPMRELAGRYGFELPFGNLEEARGLGIDMALGNLISIRRASGLLTKGFFYILAGIFVALLCFLSEHAAPTEPNLYDSLRREFIARVATFIAGFEKVMGAQVTISFINALLTGIFLTVAGMPYAVFLVMTTFVCGVLPVIGNVISNTIIALTAVTVSVKLALACLVYLVVIHKLEYFLNSKIIGGTIRTPMWVTLLGILIGEVTLGIPGIILAPALIHYARAELQAIPAENP